MTIANIRRLVISVVIAILPIYSIIVSFRMISESNGTPLIESESSATALIEDQEDLLPGSFIVDSLFQQQYDEIDRTSNKERCTRYGFKYRQGQKKRRLFFGAMVADESYDVMRMHAAEIYGLYHVVALVESNTTHTNTLRNLRFDKGTEGYELIHSGIFGPEARVHLDLYLDDAFGAMEMNREEIQRQDILKRWKKAGMRQDDVGVMADMDEVLTRDFLLAAQVCDIPMFRPGQNCHTPRIYTDTLVFEASPECVSKYWWYHPDLVIGECIEGIGSPQGRPTPLRKFKGVHGERASGWGSNGAEDYPEDVIKNGTYPLANGADMRTGVSNHGLFAKWEDKYPHGERRVTAYHFHNFFENKAALRHKYLTYGHPHGGVPRMKLSDIHKDDLDLLVRCARDLPNSANAKSKKRWEGGYNDYVGSKPIYFQNETYRRVRHAQVKLMIEEDERQHGSNYPTSTANSTT